MWVWNWGNLRGIANKSLPLLVSVTSPLPVNEARHRVCGIQAHTEAWIVSQLAEHGRVDGLLLLQRPQGHKLKYIHYTPETNVNTFPHHRNKHFPTPQEIYHICILYKNSFIFDLLSLNITHICTHTHTHTHTHAHTTTTTTTNGIYTEGYFSFSVLKLES